MSQHPVDLVGAVDVGPVRHIVVNRPHKHNELVMTALAPVGAPA